jgi:hypothetical protein
MRFLAGLSVLLLLLLAEPALAQKISDNLDSEGQTREYGKFFGYVLAAVAVLIFLLGGLHMIKGFIAEAGRGKKKFEFREEILDKKKMKEPDLYLGEKVPDWKISPRKAAIKAALMYLSEDDKRFHKNYIANSVDAAFRVVKLSIEEKSTKQLAEYATGRCLDEAKAEIAKLKKKGEQHVFGDPEITDLCIVHLEVPEGKKNHTFTALVSVKSKDYVRADKTNELLRGDKKLYAYQEFWCFRRIKGKWLVERIRPSGDMDTILHTKNVLSKELLAEFAKDADEDHLKEFVAR